VADAKAVAMAARTGRYGCPGGEPLGKRCRARPASKSMLAARCQVDEPANSGSGPAHGERDLTELRDLTG
jgi:hypothetical protein